MRFDPLVQIMSECLNDYFSQIIDLVHEGGGDVVKFAGDALLCLWWDNDMPSQAVNAVQTACTICSQLDCYKVTDNIQLSLHAGLSSGSLNAVHVGGVQSRSIFFIFSNAFLVVF
jgi:class 3 adenylate cyclase